MKQFKTRYKLARPGDKFLLSCRNHCARGNTLKEAKMHLRDALGSEIPKYWKLQSVHPATVVGDVREMFLHYPPEFPPVLLDESKAGKS
jgi:hypothetical protein